MVGIQLFSGGNAGAGKPVIAGMRYPDGLQDNKGGTADLFALRKVRRFFDDKNY